MPHAVDELELVTRGSQRLRSSDSIRSGEDIELGSADEDLISYDDEDSSGDEDEHLLSPGRKLKGRSTKKSSQKVGLDCKGW